MRNSIYSQMDGLAHTSTTGGHLVVTPFPVDFLPLLVLLSDPQKSNINICVKLFAQHLSVPVLNPPGTHGNYDGRLPRAHLTIVPPSVGE